MSQFALAEALAGVTGTRETRGRRYSLVPLLLLMVAGLLCKATSLRAVTRQGRFPAGEVAPQGIPPGEKPRSGATSHRVLKRLDAQELDQCITTWISSNTPLASGEGK